MKCDDSKYQFYAELEIFCFMVYLGREWKFERKTIINTPTLTFQDTIQTWLDIPLKRKSSIYRNLSFPNLIGYTTASQPWHYGCFGLSNS